MTYLASLLLAVAFDTPMVDTPWSCAEIEVNHWPKPNGGENVCPIFRGADGEIRDYWWHDGPWRVGRHREGALFVGWRGGRDDETRIVAGKWYRSFSGVDMEAWEASHVTPRSHRNGFGIHSQPRERR